MLSTISVLLTNNWCETGSELQIQERSRNTTTAAVKKKKKCLCACVLMLFQIYLFRTFFSSPP